MLWSRARSYDESAAGQIPIPSLATRKLRQPLRQQRCEFLTGRGELAEACSQHGVGDGQVDVSRRSGNPGVGSVGKARAASGDNHRQTAILMWIRFGVLVGEDQRRVVENASVAFGNGFQLR